MAKHSFVVTITLEKEFETTKTNVVAKQIRNYISEVEQVKKVTVVPVGEK